MSAYLGSGGILGWLGVGTTTATTTATTITGWGGSAATNATGTYWAYQQSQQQALVQYQQQYAAYQVEPPQTSPRLRAGEYDLPDGAKLIIDACGNYKILDEDAKVLYLACRVREFNPYINASDLLEAFIEDIAQYEGVDQGNVLELPIEAFIHWLILEAARRDGDPLERLPSVQSALLKHQAQPRQGTPESCPALCAP